MDLLLMKKELMRDEGLRLKPYKDSVGKLTVGVGRNLDDVGISEGEAEALLVHDIQRAAVSLDAHLPWWTKMSEERQRALLNMVFNMGIHTVLEFTNTLGLLERGEYEKAAANLAMSKWAKQVGPRAARIIAVIKGA
jgi:lysozyme